MKWLLFVASATVVTLGVMALLVTHAAPPTGQVRLAWDVPVVPSQIEDAWGLYRNVNTGPYSLLTRLDPTTWTYTDTTVRKNQTYCYTITAIRGTEESAPSSEACVHVR